jgi:predicted RNA-binding Zn ribbon-like protein
VAGQGPTELDRYHDAGVLVAVELVNTLAAPHSTGRPGAAAALSALRLVLSVDPASVSQLRAAHLEPFVQLAQRLRAVFEELGPAAPAAGLDHAAQRLNALLAEHPAHPHLAKEDGHWRLHHHPVDASLVPMWTAICAEGLARMVGTGGADRLGTCAAEDCDRVFVDLSRNASRRFCSTTCQNRVKTAAFRSRRRSQPEGARP